MENVNSINGQSLKFEDNMSKDFSKKITTIAILMAVIVTVVVSVLFKPESLTLPSFVFFVTFLIFYFAPAKIEMFLTLREKSGTRHAVATFFISEKKITRKKVLNRLSFRISTVDEKIINGGKKSKTQLWNLLIELFKLNEEFFLLDETYFKVDEFDQTHIDTFLIKSCNRATKKVLERTRERFNKNQYPIQEVIRHVERLYIDNYTHLQKIKSLINVIDSENEQKMGNLDKVTPPVPTTVARAYAEAQKSR